MRYLRIATVLIFVAACGILGWTFYSLSLQDTAAPEIEDSVGDLHLKVSDDDALLLQGLKATDDVDGDLTGNILIERVSRFSEPGVCKVSYVVFDSSNNFCRYERTVTYDDYESPRIELTEPLMFRLGEQISIMERLKLYDCLDGDITYKLKLESSNVPSDSVGVYEIELKATSNYGDEVYARIPLNIGVYSSDAPRIGLSQNLLYVKAGDSIDPLSYVTSVTDSMGNELSADNIKVLSQVDLSKAGGGQICFEVTDPRGVTGVTFLTVIVEEA